MNAWKNSFVKLNPVRGWILDIYPSGPNEVAVWIIAENGERVRLADKYCHRIYVSGNFFDLERLTEKIRNNPIIADWRFVKKHADFMNPKKARVLEISLNDNDQASRFSRKLLRKGRYERFQLCNVDVPVPQAYMYDKDLFPLAHVMVTDLGKKTQLRPAGFC